MTRKHFEALAEAMHSIRPSGVGFSRMEDWDFARTEWSKAVAKIAAVCSESNDRFNLARFIAACENGLSKKAG